MGSASYTTEQMQPNIMRFAQAKVIEDAFADEKIPGHLRGVINVLALSIADGATGPLADQAEIAERCDQFSAGIMVCEPGRGPALHMHHTLELFMPLTGVWTVYWDSDEGVQEETLEQFDCIAVPEGVYRGLRNAGDEKAYVLALNADPKNATVFWHDSVKEKLAELDVSS